MASKSSKETVDPGARSTQAIRRVQREISWVVTNDLPGINIKVDDDDYFRIHVLIEGPSDTPYSGGFFYFFVEMPNTYPWNPPKVNLITTGGGKVRFNPNLYASGKVCLSILGTWSGPEWSPAMSLSSVLLSIQSLLNSSPYFNEPGYTPGPHHDALAKSYTERVEYDTLRVAVLGMIKDTYMDAKNLPQYLKDIVHKRFVEQYDLYMKIIRANISKPSIPFNYSHLKQEFEKLKVEMANKPTAKPIPKPTAKPTAKK